MKTIPMHYLLLVSLVSVVPYSSQAQNSDGKGNGGDAVVCPDRIEMLDSIESSHTEFPPIFSVESDTVRKKLEELLFRSGEKDLNLKDELTRRSGALLQNVEEFEANGRPEADYSNTRFRDGELPNVSDEGATFIPPGCEVQQLIVRTPEPLPNQKEYSIRRDLWIQMSDAQKAVAIFHEAVYGYLVDSKVNSSPSARWYVGLASSDQLKKYTDQELYVLMTQFKFPFFTEMDPTTHMDVHFWRREFSGFSFNALTSSVYSKENELLSLKKAKVILTNGIPLIRDLFLIPEGTLVSNVELEGQAWKGFQISAVPGGDSVFNERTRQRIRPWNEFWGGEIPLITRRDCRMINQDAILDLQGAIVKKTASGAQITNVRRYHCRLDGFTYVPFFGQINYLMLDGYTYLRRWDPSVIFLDVNGNIEKVEFENRPWRQMNRY